MDIEKISQLIDLINNTNVAEIEIREGDTAIKITRQSTGTAAHHHEAGHHHHSPQVFIAPAPAANTSEPAAAPAITGHTVRSPMVGTVYLAASPTAKPFVEVGQSVKTGDVLCIVEAMKMMNQIEADKGGTVKARLVENALPVEFDQPLFIIE